MADFLERLQRLGGMPCGDSIIEIQLAEGCRFASYEIERLTAERDELRAKLDLVSTQRNRLKSAIDESGLILTRCVGCGVRLAGSDEGRSLCGGCHKQEAAEAAKGNE